MKIMGGVKGIANKQSTLDNHFLVMNELSKIIDEFNTIFGNEDITQDEHYQLIGGRNRRLAENLSKL